MKTKWNKKTNSQESYQQRIAHTNSHFYLVAILYEQFVSLFFFLVSFAKKYSSTSTVDKLLFAHFWISTNWTKAVPKSVLTPMLYFHCWKFSLWMLATCTQPNITADGYQNTTPYLSQRQKSMLNTLLFSFYLSFSLPLGSCLIRKSLPVLFNSVLYLDESSSVDFW